MATLRSGSFGGYYGSLQNESTPLTTEEMKQNAIYIYSYLLASGWSVNAIAGMLGNLQAESTINPGRWQSDDAGNTSMGYGLVQWTPSTKYTDWCSEQDITDPSAMDSNLSRILYEVENSVQWISTSAYPLSFKDFSTSKASVSELAKAFLLCYERPADQSESVQEYRASLSLLWYSALTGETPIEPETPTTTRKKKRSNYFLLFNQRKRRETWTRKPF